jgi:hypothetical protein
VLTAAPIRRRVSRAAMACREQKPSRILIGNRVIDHILRCRAGKQKTISINTLPDATTRVLATGPRLTAGQPEI